MTKSDLACLYRSLLRDKGTNRAKFLDGQVDKYTWVDTGSSWVMSDLLAAFLYGQLEKISEIQSKRRVLWLNYQRELSHWAEKHGVATPQYPIHVEHTSHLFFLRFNNKLHRDAFIAHMGQKGIATPFHYQALHQAPFAQQFKPDACPNSALASDGLVRLPLYFDLDEKTQGYIIEQIKNFSFS